MKKLLFAFPMVALLAAGCNSSKPLGVQSSIPITPEATSTLQVKVVHFPFSTTPTSTQSQMPEQPTYTKGKVFTGGGTYSNPKFGFSFVYPTEDTVTEYFTIDNIEVSITSPQTQKILDGTTGELSDAIGFRPKVPFNELAGELMLPFPLQLTED